MRATVDQAPPQRTLFPEPLPLPTPAGKQGAAAPQVSNNPGTMHETDLVPAADLLMSDHPNNMLAA